MLQHTFVHLPGVGIKTELSLWQKGINSWEIFLDEYGRSFCPFGPRKYKALSEHVELCRQRLEALDIDYFAETMPSDHLWRLFADFRRCAAYLDIETTGLGGPNDHITTAALYDGARVFHYVHGQNLDSFAKDLMRYKLLVTYNGTCFDLPFIRNYFGISVDQAHIDLRYLLAGLGYRGGLKCCEKNLGVDRGELEGVDGYLAVLLWSEYRKKGRKKALETLLAYNMADAVNLEILMVRAFNMKVANTPFHNLRLSIPDSPAIDLQPDPVLIAELSRRYFSFQPR
ncbi:MAG: ribonuclease H-like domain-containing protein [Syntrophobacteraceae bacterium]|nr:ribonuclease H-like domain-containing protein [Syntrophobacteraceae bacterium]